MADLLWLGKTIGRRALECAAVLLVAASADRLAAWRACHRPTTPAPPLVDDWRQAHSIWEAPRPSLLRDPHGPARCRSKRMHENA